MNGLWRGVVILGLAVASAQAATVNLETCQDASGRTLAGVADPALKVLVQAGKVEGQPVLRYNPDVLPELSATARQFFFAHECARATLGGRISARAADCAAVQMLTVAGALGEGDALARLQGELVFSDETWAQLSGPPRSFDFASCPRKGGLALPLPKAPSPEQVNWDACVRQCGDRLFRCAGAACQETYDRCQAACR